MYSYVYTVRLHGLKFWITEMLEMCTNLTVVKNHYNMYVYIIVTFIHTHASQDYTYHTLSFFLNRV